MTKPITPEEAIKKKSGLMPEEVIEIFNELIAKDFNGFTATVMQKDAVALIASRLNIDRDSIFKRKLLDVEPIFRKAGWEVEYDQPAYCETFDAYYKFTRKKK